MDRREDGAAFPIVGEEQLLQWVEEMGVAYTAGACVVWTVAVESESRSGGPSQGLRLAYVQRAAGLLRGCPERAAVMSRIHRAFDRPGSERESAASLALLRAEVLADILVSRARARGIEVRAVPARGARSADGPAAKIAVELRPAGPRAEAACTVDAGATPGR